MKSLRLSASALILGVLVATALQAAPATPIGTLSLAMEGQRVTIEGSVTRFQPSTYERQPNRLTVSDATGTVTVVIWPDVFGQLAQPPTQGSAVTIAGEVSQYRGELQLRVRSPRDVTVAGAAPTTAAAASPSTAAPTAPPGGGTVPLGSITAAMEGDSVTVDGTIESITPSRSPTAPNRLRLRDASGTATIVIWPEVYVLLQPTPAVGQRLRATGRVGTFRGEVQVACRDARQISLLDAGGQTVSQTPAAAAPVASSAPASPAASGEPQAMAISAIDGSTIGRRVVLEGVVAGVRTAWSPTAPNIVTLSDGTSTIPVVSWSDTWDTLARPPAQGDRVRVVGDVSLYEQRNEIQVRLRTLEYLE